MRLTLSQRILHLAKLGAFIKNFLQAEASKNGLSAKQLEFQELLSKAEHKNGWFTQDNLRYALQQWAPLLTEQALTDWVAAYNFNDSNPKTIAIIMAGNIPLVGIHDLLAVLISGNKALVKLSHNDKLLLPYLTQRLIKADSQWEDFISYSNDRLNDFDAVIATGSNNTARYFEHYFGKYPSIIRKNRSSVAVLSGKESAEELQGLCNDVMRYYGLGCRNVSKVYVPVGYDFDKLFNALYDWKHLLEQKKYENNYDYNKAVYLMSQFDFLDNGFFMLKEDSSFSSPIASLFYEYYTSLEEVTAVLEAKTNQIQCVVSHLNIPNAVPHGSAQSPALSDYADQINTLEFLLKL